MSCNSRSYYKHRKILWQLAKFYSQNPKSDFSKLKNILNAAKQVIILSGAGISAESGVPTFEKPEGLWRKMEATILYNPVTFREDPGLVWEYYHYIRELVLKAQPNAVRTKSLQAKFIIDVLQS